MYVYRQKVRDKQTLYHNQLTEAASQGRITEERVSLHSQRNNRQGGQNYDLSPSSNKYALDTGGTSLQGLGTGSSANSPRGRGGVYDSDEMSKRRQAQQRYADQLASDSRAPATTPTGERQPRRSVSRNIEDNYVSPRNNLFSTMATHESEADKKKAAQREYAQALQRDQANKNTSTSTTYTPSRRISAYQEDRNYSNNDPQSPTPYGNNGGGSAESRDKGDKQRQYALELARDAERKRDLYAGGGGGGRGYDTRSDYGGAGGADNYNNNSYSNSNNDYAYNAGPSGAYRYEAEEPAGYPSYHIPGLTDSGSGVRGQNYDPYSGAGGGGGGESSRYTNQYSAQAPSAYRSSPSTNTDYGYESKEPVYTKNAQSRQQQPPSRSQQVGGDSIDNMMNRGQAQSYGNNGGGYSGGGSGSSTGAYPGPAAPAVGSARIRGRSSGGGVSSFSIS